MSTPPLHLLGSARSPFLEQEHIGSSAIHRSLWCHRQRIGQRNGKSAFACALPEGLVHFWWLSISCSCWGIRSRMLLKSTGWWLLNTRSKCGTKTAMILLPLDARDPSGSHIAMLTDFLWCAVPPPVRIRMFSHASRGFTRVSWMCEHILLCHPSPMRTKKNEFRHQTKKKAIDRELQNPTWLTIYYTQYIIIPLGYWSLGHFLLLILSYFLYDMPPQTPLSFFTGTHPNNWHFPCPVGILTRRLITHRNTHKQAHFMEIIYTSPTPSII